MSSGERPSKTSDKANPTKDPVELIYLHFDGINQTLPLRVADYGEEGALSEDQIQGLARDFQLNISLVQELSVLLGYSLDIDSEVSLVRVKREQRGHQGRRQDRRFRKIYSDASSNAVAVYPLDKRKVPDDRRLSVVESCCYIWLDAGRTLTFTTRPDKPSSEQREGELIRFIQYVVNMVTKPRCHISGETLRRDIELVRRRFRRRGDL